MKNLKLSAWIDDGFVKKTDENVHLAFDSFLKKDWWCIDELLAVNEKEGR